MLFVHGDRPATARVFIEDVNGVRLLDEGEFPGIQIDARHARRIAVVLHRVVDGFEGLVGAEWRVRGLESLPRPTASSEPAPDAGRGDRSETSCSPFLPPGPQLPERSGTLGGSACGLIRPGGCWRRGGFGGGAIGEEAAVNNASVRAAASVQSRIEILQQLLRWLTDSFCRERHAVHYDLQHRRLHPGRPHGRAIFRRMRFGRDVVPGLDGILASNRTASCAVGAPSSSTQCCTSPVSFFGVHINHAMRIGPVKFGDRPLHGDHLVHVIAGRAMVRVCGAAGGEQ